MRGKIKYLIIVLLLGLAISSMVGFSTWNIHAQFVFQNKFEHYEDNSESPVLEEYITIKNGDKTYYINNEDYSLNGADKRYEEQVDASNKGNPLARNGSAFEVKVNDVTYTDSKKAEKDRIKTLTKWSEWQYLDFTYTYYKIGDVKTSYASKSTTTAEIENFETSAISSYENLGNTAPTDNGQYVCVIKATLKTLASNASAKDKALYNSAETASDNLNKIADGTYTNENCAAVVKFTVLPTVVNQAVESVSLEEEAPEVAMLYSSRTLNATNGEDGKFESTTTNGITYYTASFKGGNYTVVIVTDFGDLKPLENDNVKIDFTFPDDANLANNTESEFKFDDENKPHVAIGHVYKQNSSGNWVEDTRYTLKNPEVKYYIFKKQINLTNNNWSGLNPTYNGKAQFPTVTSGDVVDSTVKLQAVDSDGNTSWKNADDYTVKARLVDESGELSNNYEIVVNPEQTFTIEQLTANIEWSGTSFTYDGKEHTPTAVVKNAVVINGVTDDVTITLTITGYKATDGKAINAGDYTATASDLKGEKANNYKLPDSGLTQSFTIEQLTANIEWSGTSFTYDGKEHTPTAVVKNAVVINGVTDDVTITLTITGDKATDGKAINAGDYTATASDLKGEKANNYKLPDSGLTQSFTIAKADFKEVKYTAYTATYDGNNHFDNVKNNVSVQTVDGTTNYTVKYSTDDKKTWSDSLTVQDADTYNFHVKVTDDNGNHNDFITSEQCTATIEKANIGLAEVSAYDNVYNGTYNNVIDLNGKITTVNNQPYTITYSTDGGTNYTNAVPTIKNAGSLSFTVKITAPNHNDLEKSYTAKVSKATITITAISYGIQKGETPSTNVFDENYFTLSGIVEGESYSDVIKGTADVKFENATYGEKTAEQIKELDITENTEFTISVSGLSADNYDFAYTAGTLTVIANTQVVKPALLNGTTFTYNGSSQLGTFMSALGFTASGESYTKTIDGTTYTATVSTDKVTVNNGEKDVYTLTFKDSTDADVTTGNLINAGSYVATFTLGDNCVWKDDNTTTAIDIDFTIKQCIVTIEWSQDNYKDFTYDGSAQAPTATVKNAVTINGVTDDVKITVEITGANATKGKAINVGTYIATAQGLTGSKASNYRLPETGEKGYDPTRTFNINAKLLTITVNAEKQKITYGDASDYAANVNAFGLTFTPSGLCTGDTLNNNDVTYYISTVGDLDARLNARTYSITLQLNDSVTFKNNYSLTVKPASLTVNKKTITLPSVVTANYTEVVRTWSYIRTYLSGKVGAEQGILDNEVTVSFNKLTNGYITYNGSTASVDASYGSTMGLTSDWLINHFVGSTYVANTSDVTINDVDGNGKSSNYTISGTCIFKYQTVRTYELTTVSYAFQANKEKVNYDSTQWYTIEDALKNTTKNLAFAGDATDATTYVITAFSKLDAACCNQASYYTNYKYTVSNRKILVQFSDNTTATTSIERYTSSDFTAYGNVYSALVLPKGVSLELKNSATLTVAAQVGYNQGIATSLVKDHGVIVNNGNITVNSGCTINGHGYVKGTGNITLQSGATATDAFSIYDFPGGTTASQNIEKCMPTNAYTLHNISCETKIFAGATYKAYAYLVLSSGLIKLDESVDIVGTGSALFNATNTNSNNYVLKSISMDSGTSINESITLSNQRSSASEKITHRDKIKVYGDYHDNTISIEVLSYGFKTSTVIALPVGLMDIDIYDGTLKLTKADYMVLPGATLHINEGATLYLGDSVDLGAIPCSAMPDGNKKYSANYDYGNKDGKIIINGTLTGSGYKLGGTIATEVVGAKLNVVSDTQASFNMLCNDKNASDDEPATITLNVFGRQSENADATQLSQGQYESFEKNGSFYWVFENRVTSVTFNYGYDGKTHTQSIVLDTLDESSGNYKYTLTSSDIPNLKGTRNYYTFDGWYTNDNRKVDENYVVYGGETFYAKWTPLDYTITYNHLSIDNNGNQTTYTEDDLGDITLLNKDGNQIDGVTFGDIKEYTYGTGLDLSQYTLKSNKEGLNFGGWFKNEACTESISSITSTTNGALTIYVKWTSETKCDYTISVDSGHKDVSIDDEYKKLTVSGTEESGATFIPEVYVTWNEKSAVLNAGFMNSKTLTEIANNKYYNFDSVFTGWKLSWTYTDANGESKSNYLIINVGKSITIPALNKFVTNYGEGTLALTLTAQWEAKAKLIVNFVDSNGNSITNKDGVTTLTKYFDKSITINDNDGIGAINLICSNYTPDHYVYDSYSVGSFDSGNTAIDFNSGSADLYAKYTPATYTITFMDGDGEVGSTTKTYGDYNVSGLFITYDTSTVDYDVTKPQYFYGWSVDSKDYAKDSGNPFTLDGNKTFTAVWEDKPHKITFDTLNNATVTITYAGEKTTSTSDTSTTWYAMDQQEVKFSVSYKETENKSFTITMNNNPQEKDQFFKVTANVKINASSSSSSCLVEGTLITLADGTKKKVEDITADDKILVFNHETGTYDFAKVLFNDSEELAHYTVINLKYSNGSIVKVVSEHGFFDLTFNKYVYIDEFNYADFIGHKFYSATYDGITYNEAIVTLDKAYLTTEYVRVYSPVTKYHLNYFTEDLLSMPGGIEGLFNIFEYDDNLKYDEEAKKADLELYGELTYEDFKDLVSLEMYESYPANYFAVAIGKGILTWDKINYYIDRYGPLTEKNQVETPIDSSENDSTETNQTAILPSSNKKSSESKDEENLVN